jgi:NAD(P)H dehydrogenase (quinone)
MIPFNTFITPDIQVAVIYHSGYGSTAKQAMAVAAGTQEIPGVSTMLIPVEEVHEHWIELDDVDAMIFGTPTYMGGPSAAFKAFMESTSKVWADNLRWKNKIAGGFTNSGNMSGDKLNTLISLSIFAAQHGMQWVGLDMHGGWNSSKGSAEDLNRLGSWLGAMAQSDGDTHLGPSDSDLKTAAYLGKRVASLAKLWVAGRQLVLETMP